MKEIILRIETNSSNREDIAEAITNALLEHTTLVTAVVDIVVNETKEER